MSDVVEVNRRVTEVNVSPQFDNYSKVIIHVSDETTYEVGNNTGRTLEIDNPFGTQQMAENILQSLGGYQYQPYTARGALLDPAAEIGDAVNVRGAYGGIYTRKRNFGRLMKADIGAPQDEEINHEYQYESSERREFKRSIDDVKASLIIANDRIDASVAQTGGDNSSFGWSLTATGHKWATEYTVDKKPTKTEEGIESIHCTVCDAIKEGSERTIPPQAQEPQDLRIDPAAYTVVMGKTVDVTVTGAKGALTCEAEDPSMATATVSGPKITVKGVKTGTVKLIVKAAETADYEAGEAEFELNVVPGKTTRGDMFNLANNVKVTWLAVPGAKYYKVYRTGVTNPKESLSEPVIVTTGLVGWDKSPGLTNGNAYRYKIVASTTGAGDPSGDSPLSYSKLMYRLKTVVIRSVKNTAPGKVTVKYDRSASGDSYVLQYCERQDMVGAKTKVVLGANNTSYVIGGLKKGKTYYISIRVRKKVNGIDYYTTFGVAKKIKITQ